jgi:hypothetical protein
MKARPFLENGLRSSVIINFEKFGDEGFFFFVEIVELLNAPRTCIRNLVI